MSLERSVVTVGTGRGFIVEANGNRLIITAANCMPRLPPATGALAPQGPPTSPDSDEYDSERTYANLLGPLGGERSVWAKCIFGDPVANIAVLMQPDDRGLNYQCQAYGDLTKSAEPLPIAEADDGPSARLLSLDFRWFGCELTTLGNSIWITAANSEIRGGMSGSPILDHNGRAVGIVCVSAQSMEPHGPNPRLTHCLPAWLVRDLAKDGSR